MMKAILGWGVGQKMEKTGASWLACGVAFAVVFAMGTAPVTAI
jgi:hypothetical protein